MSRHNISSKDVSSKLTAPKPQFINLSGDYVHGWDAQSKHLASAAMENSFSMAIFSLLIVHVRHPLHKFKDGGAFLWNNSRTQTGQPLLTWVCIGACSFSHGIPCEFAHYAKKNARILSKDNKQFVFVCPLKLKPQLCIQDSKKAASE